MKRYIKDNEIKTAKQIILHKDGKQIINPTEEMILANGWVEYVVPIVEETLDIAIEHKSDEIKEFDSSIEINEFFISDTSIWLDKNTRTGLMLRFTAEKNSGSIETTLWYEGLSFTLNLEEAIQLLYALELYASQCYDNTQRHLNNISKLETIEDVKNYDYTIGYPEKLRF